MAVLLILLFINIIIIFLSRNEDIPVKLRESKLLIPFYKAGAFIYRKTFGKSENFYYRKIFDKNSLIYGAKENREITADYFIEKLGICFMVLVVGLCFSILIGFKDISKENITNKSYLKRGAYDEGSKNITLTAHVSDENVCDIDIPVNEIKYTREEFESLMEEYGDLLEKEFLGENETLDFINHDVNLVDEIKGYPFAIQWQIEERGIISRDGKIMDDIPKDGTVVEITAVTRYEEYENEYTFFAHIYPREMSKEEYLIKKIEEMINDNQEETKYEEYLNLPTNVDGMTIRWQEKKAKNMFIFAGISLLTAIGIFVGKDVDLDKQIQERNNQMMDDYAEIISKLTLFVGAGMSVVMAWKKIATDYQNKKRNGEGTHYAYEEMIYTMYEMESGVLENICYQHFANRVKVQKYVKLVSLLEQNIKMGTKGLIEDLRNEARDAFDERKNLAEKKGEESATKLLLPMFLMLLIVVVVIMVPAFMSM